MIIEKIESARDIAAVRRLRAMARAFFFFLPSLPTAKRPLHRLHRDVTILLSNHVMILELWCCAVVNMAAFSSALSNFKMAVCLYPIDLSVHLIKKYTLAGNEL